MYEEKTIKNILNDMLSRVPNDIDKREGSVVYIPISASSVEFAQFYSDLNVALNMVFVDTANTTWLDRLTEQLGITRNQPTYAVRKGLFYNTNDELMDIAINSRYGLDGITYKAIAKISAGTYQLQCEQAGTIGNAQFGNILPIDYTRDLARIELVDILIPGEDLESDESLRNRYYAHVNQPTFGGNIADYKRKTNDIEGVGATRVVPIWNGGGTVKLIILDSNYNSASDVLIAEVQNDIDPTPQGTGLGIAPIGHTVTVTTTTDVSINISTTITIQSGYTVDIIDAINQYFLELKQNWENETIVVRVSQIDSRILNLEGVVDVSGTTINGQNGNIVLTEEQIPKLGMVTIA
jgi:uncharacterized phage protein gp47/JayE